MMIEEEAEKRKNEVQDNKRTENEKERKEKEKNNNVIQVNNEEEKNMNKSLLNGVQKEEKGKEEEKKVEEKKKEEKKEEKNASEEKDDEKEKKKKEIKEEEEKKEQEKKEKKEKKEDEHIDKSAECTLGGDLCLNNIADTAIRFYEKLTEEKKEEKKEEEKKKEEKEKKNINVSSPSPPSPPPQDDSQNNENDNLKKKEEEQENDSCVAQSSSSTASSSSPSPLCPSSSSSSLSFQKEEKKDVYSSSFLAARKPSASVISPPSSSSSSSSSFSCASRIPPPLLELEPSIEMIDTYGKFIKKAEEMHKEIGVHTAKDINGEYKMLRFLIGYNFDLTAACDAYKKHLNWRKKNNINAKMRKYVKHKMIKNLMPELAPNHQNVILHFPANLLLRNMNGNEEEKEEEKEKEEEEKEEKKEEKEKEKEEMEENNNPSNSFEEQEKKEKLIGKKKEEKNDNNKNNNNNNNINTNEKKNILSKLLHRNKNNEEKEKKEVLKKKEEKKKEEKEKEEKKEEKEEEEKEEEEDICALLTDELKSKIIRDNEGNITSIERLGLIDEKRLSASLSGEEFLLWQHFQWEFRSILLDILSRESGRLVKATLINDLSGLSARCLNKHTILMLRESISSASENYPECVHRIIFINSPKVFTAVWTTVKSWLTPRTISKVVLLDSDYEASLFKYFDRKSLPLFLGGENSAKYASVPQSGLLCNDRFGLGEEHSTLTINARKKEQISYTVSEGVNVYWSWGVTDHDVGFSVKFRPNSVSAGGGGALSLLSASRAPKEITLVEFKKYDCNSTHRGVCLSPGEGVMTFTWDNSWGLLTQRTIKYKLEVVPPDERMSTQTAPSSPNAGGGGGGGGGGEVTQPQMT